MVSHEMTKVELTRAIEVVRDRARPALARFSKMDVELCKESYLFKEDHFCGLKISLGNFSARWELGHSQITIERDANFLQSLELEDQQQQRAA